VCLRWFTVTVCHPLFIRTPFELCQQSTMSTLTDLMAQANEPPTSLQEDPAAAFEHAEVELQLTEFFASPPSSLSLVYLRYVRRLTFLFRWIHVSAECQLGDLPEARHGHVLSAIEEVRHRASDMASAGQQLLSQMPDAGLPSRWGEWLEHVLEVSHACFCRLRLMSLPRSVFGSRTVYGTSVETVDCQPELPALSQTSRVVRNAAAH
ncbi:K10B2.2, partial [Symbiodinium sp. CCMP2456]